MPIALVIRHVAFEDLGAFAAPIATAGYTIQYREAGLDELTPEDAQDADLLVVLGGPIGADQDDLYPFLHGEREALRARLAAGATTLGICLGAQLMAAALGARVAPGPGKEIGWAPVELTDRGRAGPLRHLEHVPVLHWHGDAFDLPPGADRLAATRLCPHQAFALGRHGLGFQFHPEADGQGFERWLIGHAVEIAATPGVSVPALRDDARRLGPGAAEAGRRCLGEWLGGLA
ncbi:glutamine amidotransferase [Methylobacterium sp. E-066]|uniref:glutamine amidotransferase n=1 Tax=Methylobacterium sp. E-066 TaxID=2836584 RepID=UPI001FB93ABD|nr:glutamine amidotransferase [Methylobacterium sp. E-066]MCJ2142533.1 glutamine amidotransferase [Methylobacterium sp. E-066]